MKQPAFELAGILRLSALAYCASHSVTHDQERVINDVLNCRTPALGGHVEQCDQCPYTRVRYHSCRNRHCPKCQSLARAKWVEARQAELLPVEYFHVVFTIPEQLRRIAYYNRKVVYNILFQATAETLATIARDPRHLGAEIGFFAVLHTWGQNLLHHPHLHCVVPGGGLSPDGERWVSSKPGYFLCVEVLSALFRRLFLEKLMTAYRKGKLRFFGELTELRKQPRFSQYLAPLRKAAWVVYAKAPFGGPEQVLAYLGRYTHRVAISNQRLLNVTDGEVTFQWKDYRAKGREKSRVMTLTSEEFIRRFLIHVLPRGFQRIRFFGMLANRHRKARLAKCRTLLASSMADVLPPADACPRPLQPVTEDSLRCCPRCGKGKMVRVFELLPWQAVPAWLQPDTS